MKTRFLSVTLPVLLAASAALPAAQAFAAEPPAPVSTPVTPSQIDDSAMALLKKVQDTMLGLKTYRAEATTTYTFAPSEDGKQRPPSSSLATITAAKPNSMRYEQWTLPTAGAVSDAKPSGASSFLVVSDGQNVWQQIGKTYRTSPFKSADQVNTGAPWEGFYSAKISPYASVARAKSQGELLELRSMGDETVDGVLCRKVMEHWKSTAQNAADFRETWFIGPDNLVHRKTQEIKAAKISYTVDAMVRNIKTDEPVADSATRFAYTPPEGVTLYVAKPQPVLLANGVAAPEITATDKDGKTVKLSDFKGKVVVVDFWASWCPPCKASMPHNQEVTKKLQAAKVPMVLLAVDNSEEQPAFAAWVKEHPEFASLRFVYADPKVHSVTNTDYHVSGIPTQYIIDANGIIRASFVGFGGPTDDMENAVRAAVAAAKVAAK